MALVLAIEPDLRQAEILKRIVHEKVKADVVIVDSRDAAMEAMRSKIPDVMLLSALLSPRDEDELVAHLRTLDNAEHLQTHTIPQLASGRGKGKSGAGGGLLKAFRRKKNAEPEVAGCDPEHFADEVRVFLEQAEQKRFELAEQAKYKPAAKPIPAAKPANVADDPGQASTAAAATTSWDSPFEWRKNDAIPLPPTPFEEEPAPPARKTSEPPPADFDLGFDSQPPEVPSFDPGPPAPAFEPVPSFELQALVPFEAEPAPVIEAQPTPAAELDAAAISEAQAAPTFEQEAAPEFEPPLQPIEPEVAAPSYVQSEPAQEIAASAVTSPVEASEPLDAPELFETFAPPPSAPPFELPTYEPPAIAEPEPPAIESFALGADPIPEITFEGVADASVTFDLAALVESVPAVEPPPAAIGTPEEIESFGLTQLPVPEIHWIAETESEHAEVDPQWQTAATPENAIESDTEHEEVDLNWAAIEAAAETTAPTAELLDIDLDSLAVSVESTDSEADVEAPAPRKVPPSLGPLATWARLEGRTADERRPGSDMREIIERLAVPPHIAGVSYARGVRIRRVRVAGSGGRRRPADHSGPVILSRRALAATRSTNPGATA